MGVLIALAVVGLGVSALLRSSGSRQRATSAEVLSGANPIAKRGETVLPAKAALERARHFAEGRSGAVSFAVVDTAGVLRCHRCRVRYVSASVVKAMLLVAYLDGLADDGQQLSPSHRAYLDSMIRVSDNAAASVIYRHVGDAGLHRLAEAAQMSDFDVFGSWGSARITAAEQARLFARMDELTPPQYRAYVNRLLLSVVARQAWGIPEVSRPGWQTFFKGAWRTTRRGNLVHQVARLERGRLSLTIAVLTDGNPTDDYGRATVRGIAARLLRQ